MRVGVVAGGLSHERDVSLKSGRRVVDALRHAEIDAFLLDLDEQALPLLSGGSVDVVVPMLHGGTGEDGSFHSVLELLGVPFVGPPAAAAHLAFDKFAAGSVCRTAGIAVPRSFVVPHSLFREMGASALLAVVEKQLSLPLVVKPVSGGSALGVTVVRDGASLATAMVTCFGYGDRALLQSYVEGAEVAVGIVDTGDGPRTLPPVHVELAPGVPYDYTSRYTAGMFEFTVPVTLDTVDPERCAAAALAAHGALGLRGLSRTDLVVDADGTPWLLEVAVTPGMTETSLLPVAAEAGGVDLPGLWAGLVRAAAARG